MTKSDKHMAYFLSISVCLAVCLLTVAFKSHQQHLKEIEFQGDAVSIEATLADNDDPAYAVFETVEGKFRILKKDCLFNCFYERFYSGGNTMFDNKEEAIKEAQRLLKEREELLQKIENEKAKKRVY